jgi:hypothetical protein
MKNLKSLFVMLSFLAAGITFSACGGDHHPKAEDKQGKEYTSAYICPMHCEGSGSAEMGKCPTCGMDYVANKDYKGATEPAAEPANTNEQEAPAEEAHDDHDHEGHSH